MHTYMDHLRLREEEREGKEAGESEEGKERKGEGESKSTVDRLVCLAADDSFADDSASAASTTQFFVTIFALVRGLRSYVLCCWSRKAKEAWQQAELLLLEGLQKLTVLSRWAVVLLTQVEQRRREVSDLRIRHRSRGTAQETLRQSLHCTQAYQQALDGAWEAAEQLLLDGLQKLAPRSYWTMELSQKMEECRRGVSELLLAEVADRESLTEPMLLLLQSVGCHAGKT